MKDVIATNAAPGAVGPYSQGIKTDTLVFTAGQLGIDPETGDFAGDDVTAQTRQAMENLQAVLKAAGTDLAHVVKTTIFVADMDDFAAVNDVYGRFFGDAPPARSTVQVAALPLGGRVEIEMIAVLP
jgi:2-iminobutanoate/2-iminopropanoate deaminase